jgi:hypothetical protein
MRGLGGPPRKESGGINDDVVEATLLSEGDFSITGKSSIKALAG